MALRSVRPGKACGVIALKFPRSLPLNRDFFSTTKRQGRPCASVRRF